MAILVPDLHLSAACADQDRRAGVALHAAAGVQQEPSGGDFLAQLAIAIRGHGKGPILRITHEHRLGPARRELAAQPQRLDIRRQLFVTVSTAQSESEL